MKSIFHSIVRQGALKTRVGRLHGNLTPPLKAKELRVDGFCAAIQRVLAAPLAAVVFAFATGVAFAAGGTGTPHRTIGTNWIDERAATTGQTGSWSEGVAYDPDTQTADIDGEAVFMPNAASAGNYVTLKFTMTLDKVAEDKSPEADAQAGLRVGTNGCFQVWTKSGWLDVAAKDIAPVTGAEYGISFVLDYARGKYSVSVRDAKTGWRVLQSKTGAQLFPIAVEGAYVLKSVTFDGQADLKSIEGSYTSGRQGL